MQSNQLWFKKLAKSRYQNGRWETDGGEPVTDNPFESLRADLLDMLEIYNHHSKKPIKALIPSGATKTLLTLMCGSTQMRLVMNDGYLDIGLVVTRNFQTVEIPVTRLAPRIDRFGASTWLRGTSEFSTDQLIKNAFVQLIESSDP